MIISALNPVVLTSISMELLAKLNRNRALLLEQVRRELVDQHAGQVFGGAWSILHPLLQMLIYVFVFSFVFQNRIGGTHDLPLDYTSYILSGLSVWLAIVQALGKTSTALTSNSNLIKQVVFPIEILPVKTALSTMAPLLVMLGVYFCYTLIWKHDFLWTQLLIPVLLIIYAMWTIGIGLILSSVTVFIRDIREIVHIFTVAGVFLLPVIYLPAWVPAIFKPLLYLNPFSYIIWCFQDALYFGRFEHPWAWFIAIGGGLFVFMLGTRVFRGLKPYFGDTL